MKFAETLYFVGECLSLELHPEKIDLVKNEIADRKVDWEKVVQISSSHLVLPALFIQIKRASLLHKLPVELTKYLNYLTDKNRERNQQILQQVHDISTLLNAHGIRPVFIKGVAHLLTHLYEDDAERMLGDIDVLVMPTQVIQAAELLISKGYKPLFEYNKYIHQEMKHYPRLMHDNYPAAVEVHRQVLLPPHHKRFSGDHILKNAQKAERELFAFIPSIEDLIIHNALNMQINDKAYLNHYVNLRQMYDLQYLSCRADSFQVLNEFGKYKKLTNAWFGLTAKIMGSPKVLQYEKNWYLCFYLKRIDFFLNHSFIHTMYLKIVYILERLQRYIVLPVQSVFNVQKRKGLFARLSNPKWYVSHINSYRSFFRSNY